MKYFFALLSLFLFFRVCKSYSQDIQPALLVTYKNDSITGFVTNKIINGTQIQYYEGQESKSILKDANEIKEIYQNGNQVFLAYTVIFNKIKENIFLKLLEQSSSLKLYKGRHESLGEIYVVQKNEKLVSLNNRDLASSYSFLYGDCPDQVLKSKYLATEKSIVKEFVSYNECMGYSMKRDSAHSETEEIPILIGPVAGLAYNNFSFPGESYFGEGDYKSMIGPKLGITSQFKFSKRFSFLLDVAYLKKIASSDSVNTPPVSETNIYSSLVKFDFDILDLELYLDYALVSTTKFDVSAIAGFNYGFLVGSKFTQEANGYGLGETGPPTVDFDDTRDSGFILGIGGAYKLENRSIIQIHIQYNISNIQYNVYRTSSIIDGYGAGKNSMKTNSIELCLHYLFRIK